MTKKDKLKILLALRESNGSCYDTRNKFTFFTCELCAEMFTGHSAEYRCISTQMVLLQVSSQLSKYKKTDLLEHVV